MELIAKKSDFTCAAMLIASWIKYNTGVNEAGEEVEINDPAKDVMGPLAKAINEANDYDPSSIVKECLGEEIGNNPEFNKAVQ